MDSYHLIRTIQWLIRIIIEHFYRHLKSILKSYLNTTDWVDTLPIALLGIRTTLKQDYHCISVEVVYGTTLRVPGNFFTPNLEATVSDPSNYVTKLKESMKHFRATPPRNQQRSTYTSEDLQTCTHALMQ